VVIKYALSLVHANTIFIAPRAKISSGRSIIYMGDYLRDKRFLSLVLIGIEIKLSTAANTNKQGGQQLSFHVCFISY